MSAVYDPIEFAAWLSDAFRDSHFKSWQAVAERVGVTRSTLSRFAGAKPQSLTGKAGQPKAELVIKLARLFGRDVDQALMIAGHAPIGQPSEEGLFSGFEKLSPEMKRIARRQIQAIIDLLAEQDEVDTDYIED